MEFKEVFNYTTNSLFNNNNNNNNIYKNLTNINSNLTQMSNEEKLLILNIRLYVYGWLVFPIAIIGIILNGFTVVVLLHPRMRSFSTNAYLTSLSLANIVCLVNFIFLYSIRYLVSYEIFKKNISIVDEIHPYESFINLIYGIWSPIFTTFQLYAIYLTVAVTVDRWIYVTWPLKADSICTMKNTFRAIGFIFLFCFIYNLPRWFEIESYQIKSSTNRSYHQARTTKFGNHDIYNQIMRKYGYIIFVYGLPFTILLVVNIGIIRKLIEAKRRKNNLLGKASNQLKPLLNINNNGLNMNHNQNHNNTKQNENYSNKTTQTTLTSKKNKYNPKYAIRASIASTFKLDPKVTLMVMAIVIAFFLCQFPYLIINILANSNLNKTWFHISKSICDLLVALNCCINFIIYCFFGQNFRQVAKLILCNPSLNPYSKTNLLRNNHTMLEKNKSKRNSAISEALQGIKQELV